MLRDAPLLSDIASFQDLSELPRSAAPSGPFPFDDAAEYDGLFENIARILNRSQAHHVLLVGERGVGKHTIIAELARRAVNSQPAFLGDKRIITADCRYVCPEDSRRMIVGILNTWVARTELFAMPVADSVRATRRRACGDWRAPLRGLPRGAGTTRQCGGACEHQACSHEQKEEIGRGS